MFHEILTLYSTITQNRDFPKSLHTHNLLYANSYAYTKDYVPSQCQINTALTTKQKEMKELNNLEKIELEIEREKQNLREWKRKVQILEIGKEDDERRTDLILERISELIKRKENLKK